MTFENVLNLCGSTHTKFGKNKGYSDLITFDLKNKKISNGTVVLMDKGKIVPQKLTLGSIVLELTEDMELTDTITSNPYEKLEELYKQYKYSVSEPYDSYAKRNFKAIDINKLSMKQFRLGMSRQKARIMLEAYVILTNFPWENEKHFYWQSQNDKDLILFKEWR